MQVTATNNEYVLPKPPAAKTNYLDQEAFMQVLVAQLENQNPLEPMTDRDFFAQLAQLGTVQGIDRIGATMQTGQAASMIGKTVAIRPETGTQFITGKVESVEISGQKVFVRVNGARYNVSQVVGITN